MQADAFAEAFQRPVAHGVHVPSSSVAPRKIPVPRLNFEEALKKPWPGVHEALVIDRQLPPVGCLYRPAGHDSMPSQQRPFLTKVLLGEEHGAEVLAEMESVLQPREVQAYAFTSYTGTLDAFGTLNDVMVFEPSPPTTTVLLRRRSLPYHCQAAGGDGGFSPVPGILPFLEPSVDVHIHACPTPQGSMK